MDVVAARTTPETRDHTLRLPRDPESTPIRLSVGRDEPIARDRVTSFYARTAIRQALEAFPAVHLPRFTRWEAAAASSIPQELGRYSGRL